VFRRHNAKVAVVSLDGGQKAAYDLAMGKVAASSALLVEPHERAPRPFEAVRPDPHEAPLDAVRPDPRDAPLEALRVATAELSQVRAVERLPAVARDAALRGLGADLLTSASSPTVIAARRRRRSPWTGRA
jgi:hypothetical protein